VTRTGLFHTDTSDCKEGTWKRKGAPRDHCSSAHRLRVTLTMQAHIPVGDQHSFPDHGRRRRDTETNHQTNLDEMHIRQTHGHSNTPHRQLQDQIWESLPPAPSVKNCP
jgi:hypothetical protein